MAEERLDDLYNRALRDADVGGLIASARRYIDAERLDDAQTALLAAGRLQPREGEIYRWLGEVLLRRGDAERAEKVLEKAVQFGCQSNPIAVLEQARSLIPTQHAAGDAAVAELVAQASSQFHFTGPSMPRRQRPPPPESDGEVPTAIRRVEELHAQIDAVLSEPSDYGNRSSDPLVPASKPQFAPDLRSSDPDMLRAPTRSLEFDIQPKPLDFGAIQPPAQSSRPNNSPIARAATQPLHLDPPPTGPIMPPVSSSRGALPMALPSSNPMLLENLGRPAIQLGGAAIPQARDVLEALELAGVYEPQAAQVPQIFPWTRPERIFSKRGIAVLIGFAGALLIGGVATFVLVTNQRARDHITSEQMLAQVDKDLDSGDATKLAPAEASIAKSFDLDSRSPHAALTWLHERVSVGLLKGGQDIAFEDGTARAKEIGIEDKRMAFAFVASYLFQGDTAGAAAEVAKWDSATHDDPWFQLLAGATFERAGDPRALERYTAALQLAPENIVAQILLTRATAVDGDAKRAGDLAREIRIRNPQRIDTAALVILAWARDPYRGEPPPETKDVLENADSLPLALRSVPYAARAILAIPKGMADEAKSSLTKGLALADTPGMATWLGSIALVTGDEEIARKAALAALSFSAAYPPARILAARVALFAARLDEALKATEELPPSSPDIAVITAAASYEKLDSERMSRALEAITDEQRKLPYTSPLVFGQQLMAGKISVLSDEKALNLSDDQAPWADLVAMDWALDAGDLDLAKKLADAWKGDPRPLRAIRLARFARYDNRLDDADKLSKTALENGTPTLRALSERVFTLIAMKKDADAVALFKTYPNVGGNALKWLRAYAVASHGKIDEAKAMISNDDPPPNGAPMGTRIIAAMAYAAMKDTKHGGDYAKAVVQSGFASPDVAWIADRLNAGKVTPRGPSAGTKK